MSTEEKSLIVIIIFAILIIIGAIYLGNKRYEKRVRMEQNIEYIKNNMCTCGEKR